VWHDARSNQPKEAPMKVAIELSVPVKVFIDTETEEVESVLVETENVWVPTDPGGWDVDNGWVDVDPDTVDLALDVAENKTWPKWSLNNN
jgi:hypothetical protein